MKIKVLVIEPNKKPYEKEIENELKVLQNIVDGYIQGVYLENKVMLVCNEDGKLNGSVPNRYCMQLKDVIYGTFFITGTGKEDFDSLSEEHINKYKRIFSLELTGGFKHYDD